MLAGVAALAVTPLAYADNGFPDFRQAAADQYPQQPPPGTSGSGSGPSSSSTSGSSGRPKPVRTQGHKFPKRLAKAPSSSAGGSAPVVVPTQPAPAATGSLPFTGSDLSGLVVLALALIAAGLFTGAIARATRRRRRHAPA